MTHFLPLYNRPLFGVHFMLKGNSKDWLNLWCKVNISQVCPFYIPHNFTCTLNIQCVSMVFVHRNVSKNGGYLHWLCYISQITHWPISHFVTTLAPSVTFNRVLIYSHIQECTALIGYFFTRSYFTIAWVPFSAKISLNMGLFFQIFNKIQVYAWWKLTNFEKWVCILQNVPNNGYFVPAKNN